MDNVCAFSSVDKAVIPCRKCYFLSVTSFDNELLLNYSYIFLQFTKRSMNTPT